MWITTVLEVILVRGLQAHLEPGQHREEMVLRPVKLDHITGGNHDLPLLPHAGHQTRNLCNEGRRRCHHRLLLKRLAAVVDLLQEVQQLRIYNSLKLVKFVLLSNAKPGLMFCTRTPSPASVATTAHQSMKRRRNSKTLSPLCGSVGSLRWPL
ncbi:MAG: hypothetical protein G01um101477_72 [Candidatus Doudnabacteria bacterium Gr01-1014_77]|uniref:Uncharacterized protein n=1 Tax=Candidatus Doudnabacteria bacterium Gr01-1014_77 TaxID=2017133 RepID=A0A554JDK7_9BACT|nr:MAG: hypothetical protein G01um101477_72 [Candidatus Doudnabacteria bacterium Gr01-1014_77]